MYVVSPLEPPEPPDRCRTGRATRAGPSASASALLRLAMRGGGATAAAAAGSLGMAVEGRSARVHSSRARVTSTA
eukprot:3094400-Prymnesium_polylepis.1